MDHVYFTRNSPKEASIIECISKKIRQYLLEEAELGREYQFITNIPQAKNAFKEMVDPLGSSN